MSPRLKNDNLGITDAASFKAFATRRLMEAESFAGNGDIEGALRNMAHTIALLVGVTTALLDEHERSE